ncbi:MAG: mechanosensitive ion channel [Saprospiraceae bacterium]|nr:mechanosensitive ion channel [Saprospiraceae bacterium]
MLTNTFLGNTTENWLIAVCVVVFSFLMSKIVYRILRLFVQRWTKRTKTSLDDLILTRSGPIIMIGIILFGFRIAFTFLEFDIMVYERIQRGFILATVFVITWFFSRLISTLIEEFLKNQTRNEVSEMERFSPVLIRMVTILIWALGIITGLNNAGMDVGALLAGLGIGGLAVALASQDTVKNMIGGLIILFDKPFRIGEKIKVDSFEGIVEDIGLRSTKLRGVDGMLITMPNTLFSDRTIINISRLKDKKVETKISLSRNNEPDMVKKVCFEIENILNNNPSVIVKSGKVLISSIGATTVVLTMEYRIKDEVDSSYEQHQLLLEIYRYLHENNIIISDPE